MRPLPRSLVRRSGGRAATALAAAGVLAATACASAGGPSGGSSPVATTARGCPAAPARLAAGRVVGAATRVDDRVRDPRAALREICAMMERSAAAWNRGDLAEFMTDYLPGEGTTFVGRRGIVRGPEGIRAGYAPRFGPGGMHDSLSFEEVEVDLLAPDVANTIAYYVLARGDSVVARGPTSLVMRRVKGEWKIVHDHSS